MDTEYLIAHTHARFDAHDRRWPSDFVRKLDDLGQFAAFCWSIDLFRKCIPRSDELNGELSEALNELASYLQGDAIDVTAEHLTTRYREVWICRERPSLVRRGVARLFGALAAHRQGDRREYVSELVRAVTLLADDFEDQWRSEVLETAVKLFREEMRRSK